MAKKKKNTRIKSKATKRKKVANTSKKVRKPVKFDLKYLQKEFSKEVKRKKTGKAKKPVKKPVKKKIKLTPENILIKGAGILQSDLFGQSVRRNLTWGILNNSRIGLKKGTKIIELNKNNILDFENLHEEIEDFYIKKFKDFHSSPQYMVQYSEDITGNMVFDYSKMIFFDEELNDELSQDEDYKKAIKALKEKVKRTFKKYGFD
jgi:hypothetical protein